MGEEQGHIDSCMLHSQSDSSTLRSLSISVDEQNVIPGALRLIHELRPDWNPQDVQTKLFTDGLTNKLLACFVDAKMDDAVLVRIYGKRTELFVNREDEVTSFQLLGAHGCAPALYCTFQNGLCYQFMRGLALGPEHVRDTQIFRWPAGAPSLKDLENELSWLKKYLPTLESPIVLCHNDLLCKNVIYNEEEGHVRFIDYEYTGYNYQAYDIANHFNEFAGVSEPDYRLFPGRQAQLHWLRHYLEAYRRMKNEEGDLQEEEVEDLYAQVNQFVLVSLWPFFFFNFTV
ncbi:ethanolamine kinase 2 isoform X2 [Pelobates cultripes]|uniref:ethanolamine kinase n=1 Tax=Pelobates cultripes TaxID=61616 RepID=A0AAD1R1G3_PELCU|nr:ethanolamine kinase 2 isoform X2 [Pelobates cultripes]